MEHVSMVQGTVHEAFRPVADELGRQLARGGSGAAVCVYHRGACVVDAWAGVRDARGTPWSADTTAMCFSTTKGLMATLAHRLVDRGALDYDDPVAKHWPEFGQAGKARISVRDVLTHRAGLHAMRTLAEHAEEMLDWERMTARLAAAAPEFDRRGRSAYHALTFGWLVGEIARRATGEGLRALVHREIVEPLGLDGATLGAPREERHRVADLVVPEIGRPRPRDRVTLGAIRAIFRLLGLDPGRAREALLPRGARDVIYSARVLDAEIPAMNGVFTARSLARMYAALAGGGVLEGRRFLSEQTLARATEIQCRTLDAVIGFPMRWRLGYHLVGTSRGILPRAFGHFGYGGSGAFADPERDLAVALVVNRIAGTPIGDGRMLRLGAIAARCASSVSRR